mmetsp:Transcript_10541/g.20024  ORF Transcript_10541/g.20024 Transcript_10541/m.20024 type:complete len:101 (+) Transcript_10541:66-368(+)|eukprot:CAMPEP_0114256346 /NCGR_PEP_ID=MMETSP0058-20121206/18097_1 /TAXON_ID=36894 /ORGANISM="Pyramimonas parkeae, CCMP726" /LENGTH=100 /DNA_ID=CAMNT_0001370893 /DNA_START=59 /DNA_END=361 /DNA_ORIENTATION=+
MSAVRKIIPLLDRVLVQKIKPVQQTSGGILLPESAGSKVNSGVVVAAGPGGRTRDGGVIPLAVKEGDKVLLPEYGGTNIKFDDVEYFMYRDEDLLGVLKD